MVKKRISIIVLVVILLFAYCYQIVYADIIGKVFSPPTPTGRITSLYGPRSLFGRDFHYGIDIAIPIGTPIYAAQSGIVTMSGRRGGYGYLVEIRHDGQLREFKTRYGHNSSLLVSVGDHVEKGDLIALSGNTGDSTGPHVHYEVRRSDYPIDPLINTDFLGFDHNGLPVVNIVNFYDAIMMGLENTIITFFNIMEEHIMHPFISSIPIMLKVDFDITKVAVVQRLHAISMKIAFNFLPLTILFYVIKVKIMNLLGDVRDFTKETFAKFFRAGILIQFSLFLSGIYLGVVTSIIMFFIHYVDSDYAKIMYEYNTVVELFTEAGINAVLVIVNFFLYFLLFIVVMIRVVDMALVVILTPIIIPFAEFVDKNLYIRLGNLYTGQPVAQFVTVLCFAFAIGFAKAVPPSIESLGLMGRFIITISSAVYALVHPAQFKRIFELSSIQAIDALLVGGKGMLVANNNLFKSRG